MTTTTDEEYYMLDIRTAEEEGKSIRMHADHVVQTGIILTVFSSSQRRYSPLRKIHCALDQWIDQNCKEYRRNSKKDGAEQLIENFIQTNGGLWHWNGQAFVPIFDYHSRLQRRFRDSMRRQAKQCTDEPQPPVPQRFVIRTERGIIAPPPAAADEPFDALESDGCQQDGIDEMQNDILSDVSSITTAGDWQNPSHVVRQAELNCLRVVNSNLREQIQMLEWQLRESSNGVFCPMMDPLASLALGDVFMDDDDDEEEEEQDFALEDITSSPLRKVE